MVFEQLVELVSGQTVGRGILPQLESDALLLSAQPAHVTVKQLVNAPTLLFQWCDFSNRQIRFVLADVQIVEKLFKRAAGIQTELDLLQIMKSPMPFRDVVCQGNRSPPNLAAEFKFFKRGKPPVGLIHCLPKFPRNLISFQIFKGAKRFLPRR